MPARPLGPQGGVPRRAVADVGGEYEALDAAHPEPMFRSAEEADANEGANEASWLWMAPPEGDEVPLTPTVVYRAGGGVFEAAVADHERGRALFVFGSEEEAEGYRLRTGNYPAEEGFVNVPVDVVALKDLLALHECTYVVMPVSMVGDEGPDFFAAGDFVGMLESSPPA